MRNPRSILVPALLAAVAGQASAQPFVAPGDIVVGWSQGSATPTPAQLDNTIQLFDHSGVQKPDSWNHFPFIQSIEWDNTAGVPHNPAGNLLGMDFGNVATGGRIYAYQSGSGWAGVELFNAGAAPSFSTYGLTLSRTAGVSVSPDNTHLAFAGYDTGKVYILNYDAAARAVTGGIETFTLPPVLTAGDSAGTTWLDNGTVVALSSSGDLATVDAATASTVTVQTHLPPPAGSGGSEFTSLAYNPAIAPYIYASYSTFITPSTVNALYVIDPRTTPWTVAAQIDLSDSANTMREIALAAPGDLFFMTFGSSSALPTMQKITGVTNPGALTNNSSVVVATGTFGASFSGIDVAGGAAGVPCYADCNGDHALNVNDFVCFQSGFAAGSLPVADCNHDNTLNVNDFVCFQSAFAAGCSSL